MICIAKPGFDLCCQRMVILSGKAGLPAWREAKHAAMLGAPVVTGSGHLRQLNPIAFLSHVMHKFNTARSKVRYFFGITWPRFAAEPEKLKVRGKGWMRSCGIGRPGAGVAS